MNYNLRGLVDSYDVDGSGDTMQEMLLAYAADCRRSAANYRELTVALEAEADKVEMLARAERDHEAVRK